MSVKGRVSEWSTEEVGIWLQNNGFQAYKRLFCITHKIDGVALLCITEEDLKNHPLNISVFGDIKRLTVSINRLRMQSGGFLEYPAEQDHGGGQSLLLYDFGHKSPKHRKGIRQRRASSATCSMNGHKSSLSRETLIPEHDNADMGIKRQPRFEREIYKTVISFIYVTLVIFLTAFVMVEVHERVPDVEKYPPLPDIVLDNLPFMPWAFKAAELCGVILTLILLTVIFLHKHKYIVLRRLFAITGTVFLLRCLTMFVTALSVPDHRLECTGRMYGDLPKKFWRAVEICTGFGMSLTGVRTCGDYMFSGHTIVITTWNHFITEYSPRNFNLLHTLSWILNIFGCFFILAAHEHYSIDVIIAFYITSRLFLYYHTLANSQINKNNDERTKVWFPMFSFFEANVEGSVPNEFEWPMSMPRTLHELR